MSIVSKIFGGTIVGPVVDAGIEYIKQNGLTSRALEKTKQISELAASTWRPAIAQSIRKSVIFCLAFTALMTIYCLIALSFGAKWVNFGENTALSGLWARWEWIVSAFFEFSLYFLVPYATLREVGKGRDSIAVKAVRKMSSVNEKRKVQRETLQVSDEPMEGIEGVSYERPRVQKLKTVIDFENDFTFSARSDKALADAHDDLVRTAFHALSKSRYDFAVIESVRSLERQAELYKAGKSQTMNSRHLHGLAIDIMAYDENGKSTWEPEYYIAIASAFEDAAKELNIPVVWGGSWSTLRDYGHFELDRRHYPDPITELS